MPASAGPARGFRGVPPHQYRSRIRSTTENGIFVAKIVRFGIFDVTVRRNGPDLVRMAATHGQMLVET
jgi:hypothetical protein